MENRINRFCYGLWNMCVPNKGNMYPEKKMMDTKLYLIVLPTVQLWYFTR